MKLVFVGSQGAQSLATLAELKRHGLAPHEILIHGADGIAEGIPLRTPADGIATWAARHGLAARQLSPGSLFTHLLHCDADRLLVSCYPARLPERVLACFPHRCYNLHPSPLPAFRGPSPIFWQLRAGRRHIGVSVHHMTACMDQGALLGRGRFMPPTGADWSELHQCAGALGARLFLHGLKKGREYHPLANHERHSSYQPAPGFQDFEVSPCWTRRHAQAFIDGVSAIGTPWLRDVDGKPLHILSARPATTPLRPRERPFHCADGVLLIQLDEHARRG